MRLLLSLIGLTLAAAASSAAEAPAPPRPLALEDLHRVQDLTEPRLSPDGQWVAWVTASHDLAHDATVRRIWRARLDGSQRQALNAPPADSPRESQWAIQWSADNSVYYLSDRGDAGNQVWVQPANGGAPRPVSHLPADVAEYAVSPDGQRIAFVSQDPAPPVPEGHQPAPLVTERFQFMEGDVGEYLDDRRRHLYVAPLATDAASAAISAPLQLTAGAHDEALPSWSPDSRRLAYVSKRGDDPDRHIDFNLFSIEAREGAAERQLTDYPGSDLDPYWGSPPAWSPDGRRIAYLRGGAPKWIGYAPTRLAVLDVGTLKVSEPAAAADRFFYSPRWSTDGRALYALKEDAESTHVVRLDLDSSKMTEVTTGPRFDAGFDVGRGDRVVVLGNDTRAPYEVFALATPAGGALRPVSRMNDEWLAGVRRQPVEDVRFRSKDGTEIHGLLVRPANAVPGQPVPTIVRLHGGPVYQFSHEFMFEWQWFAAQGYAVLAVNPRGSSGRGFDFARAIYADWGRLDVQDVLAGADWVVKAGIADPKRMGVGGHSYGAILTHYVIASDRRFQAATSSSGGNNLLMLYGLDEYAREYEIELGTPWRNTRAYERISYPFLHADRIATPTLFLCGGDDFNVPCGGAQQMYQALRSLKVPTRFVRFPKQGHQLDVPSYLEFRLRSYGEWYERYLKR
jgi:dipeptidyl aminopeptidase/acylaminoacyl peptidase